MDLPLDVLATWLLFISGGTVMLAVVTLPAMRYRPKVDARLRDRSELPRQNATARRYGKVRARWSWAKRADEAVA